MSTPTKKMPRLREKYRTVVVPALQKRLNANNVMQVPRLDKIVINIGIGKATQDAKLVDESVSVLTAITGQKPVICRAKKAISNFKLKKDQAIGCKVTLRGDRMFEFLERLLCLALPRIRDFRGVTLKAFDGKGNYSLGLTEQLIFPEIDPDKVKRTQGMNIAFVTSAGTDEAGAALLREFGMPFSK